MRLIAWLICCCLLSGCSRGPKEQLVCAGYKCIRVELARTAQQRMKGLQNRESLGSGEGMLFLFPQRSRHAFWMKDTKIPLDMIWINDSRRVVHVEANVPPCRKDPCPSYVPASEARYVLEVNAGKARSWGINVGSRLQFRLNLKESK